MRSQANRHDVVSGSVTRFQRLFQPCLASKPPEPYGEAVLYDSSGFDAVAVWVLTLFQAEVFQHMVGIRWASRQVMAVTDKFAGAAAHADDALAARAFLG